MRRGIIAIIIVINYNAIAIIVIIAIVIVPLMRRGIIAALSLDKNGYIYIYR